MGWRPVAYLGLALSLLLLSLFPLSATSATGGYHVVYERGHYVSRPDADLKRNEEWARGDGGHMPWRRYPLLTAQVLAGDLLPPSARSGKWSERVIGGRSALVLDGIEWLLMGEHDGKASVRLKIKGRTVAEVRLIQPFRYWWYVSSARPADVKRSRLAVIHPDGEREFLRGPLLLIRGRAYLPIRDLERVQLAVKWQSEKRAVAVYVPGSDNIASFRAGKARIYGVQETTGAPGHEPIAWRPFTRDGHVFVPARDIAKWFRTFIPAWDLKSSSIRLYIQPFKAAGPAK